MSNENKARLAHELLDEINARQDLTPEQTEVLRSFLPERPKRKTLEALRHDVHDVWAGVIGNEWPDDMYCNLETWLYELHAQLQGLAPDMPAHPKFLETEADYENAPVGTVVIREGGYPWTRIFDSWVAYSRNDYSHSEMAALRGKSRILRWAVGNEQL